jgi:hypothetical protein
MSNQQRYVVHIDILGMRTLVAKDPDKAWELLSKLATARNTSHSVEVEFAQADTRVAIPDQVRAVTFSDTILLFSKGDSEIDLKIIVMMTTELMVEALHLGVPIRAGIARGTFFFNLEESMYAGPALIEAYDLGESAQWIGIVTSAKVFKEAQTYGLKSGVTDVVVETAIPLDEGQQTGYAINWLATHRNAIVKEPPFSAKQVYDDMDLGRYFGDFDLLPPRAKAKYENTARFMNAMYPP